MPSMMASRLSNLLNKPIALAIELEDLASQYTILGIHPFILSPLLKTLSLLAVLSIVFHIWLIPLDTLISSTLWKLPLVLWVLELC
jgi:hypothetical protein